MQIAWFCGFGWVSVVTLVLSGLAINLLSESLSWFMYIPFLVIALYMTVRFRVYTLHPWRRVHSRAMQTFGKAAAREHDAAKTEERDYDIRKPCEELQRILFVDGDHSHAQLLNDRQRKDYYRSLVAEFPEVFLKTFKSSDDKTIFKNIDKDIEASELGPDILIAKSIELKYSRKEAATYLQSLMLGTVR